MKPNETQPDDIMKLAVVALNAVKDSQASPAEKAAALRTAAFAIEQASQAQSVALVINNLINKSAG